MAETKTKGGGLGGWFSALMGKPVKKTTEVASTPDIDMPVKKVVPETPIETPKTEIPLEVTDFSKEDSVKEDLKKFKEFIGKTETKLGEKMAPITSKGAERAVAAINAGGNVSDAPFYKKILKVFFILFFAMILIFVAGTLFNLYKRKEITPGSNDPTPTPIPYEPTKPSVYAQDEQILKLEEDISVLEKELVRAALRENDLVPPRLDFDVTFK